jgi:hypothetical protein
MNPSRFRRKSQGLIFACLALLLLTATTKGVTAQSQNIPFYGKNRVKYDKFDWHIYQTDHFEIYYYPELEEHLERVTSYAESAYQQISANLQHELAFVVPLIIFKTHSEFEQQNLIPGASPEGVGAFAEPQRNRIVLPLDEPPDGLYRLIAHELTHIFMFDAVPRSIISRDSVPLWVDEGMADYQANVWRPLDLMQVRDVSISDSVPSMTNFQGYGGFANARVVYNLGHAVFEFIEGRWGQTGIREFLFGLRQTSIGGGDSIYEEAFDLDAEEFDDEFRQYLDDRFEAFKDKERPVDYGRNLAPDALSRYPIVLNIESSPSGEVIAAVAVNRKDQETDIILLSAKTGEVIDNLTEGFDQSLGFDYIPTPGLRFNTVSWTSWSPDGDRLAYFVRKGKHKSLVIQNVVTKSIERRIDLDTVDEPESPDFSPDGTTIVFSALRAGVGDIFEIDLATDGITNLTNDEFADYAPLYAPDGSAILHLARVSGNNKYFRIDRPDGARTQLTFGTHDDAGGQFIDKHTLVFSSTAVDPAQPITPDFARDGEIFNIWTLDLENGELQQYTDTATGNVNPIVIRGSRQDDTEERIAFVTYYKGDYSLHSIIRDEALYTTETQNFGSPGPIIDFQAPLSHTLIRDNSRQKGAFENILLEGRPPVNFGVTSNGDLLGGTQIVFTDLLGDQQLGFTAYSVSQYRTYGGSYTNLAGRMQFGVQGFSQSEFFYGNFPGRMFDSSLALLSRDDAIAVRTTRGGSFNSSYPLDRFRRLEFSVGLFNFNESYDNPALQAEAEQFQQAQFGANIFNNGSYMPLGVALVQETTIFRQYGPLSGSTFRFGYEFAPAAGDSLLSRQTADVDARKYLRIGENGVLAVRGRGFKSWGDSPDFTFFGGNSEMRGYNYLEFLGHKAFFSNAELRFPLIEAMATPIGVLSGVRGAFFFNIGMASFEGESLNPWSSNQEVFQGVTSLPSPNLQAPQGIFSEPTIVDGFRLVNARASYGISLSTLALGFPVHFDWAWRTLFNKNWENVVFANEGGSEEFRRVKFSLWVGYDF